MKKRNLFFGAIIALTLVFVSCEEKVTDFEGTYLLTFETVATGEDGYWNGSDLSGEKEMEVVEWVPGVKDTLYNYVGGFKTQFVHFANTYTTPYNSWLGFACSSKTDTQTPGYENQYSVIAGSGANKSTKFAVAYEQYATFTCPKDEHGYFSIKSMMLTNSTYTYLALKNGEGMAKKFEAGDWYKVIITGYKSAAKTGSVDYYLADFRDGKSFIADSWAKVDVSSLAEVDKVVFSFESSDVSGYGINTPVYVCIDNIEFTQGK